LKKAYLEWRAPLLINSNWWLAFYNDTTVPQSVVGGQDVEGLSGIGLWQVRRAAWMVHRVLEFKDKLEQCVLFYYIIFYSSAEPHRQEVYPETTRTGLWFRNTVEQMFYTCRIPRRGCDSLAPQPPHSLPNARKIVLMIDDWIYAVEVYHTDGSPVSPVEIERRILETAKDFDARVRSGERAVPVGILTSDDRDTWATVRTEHVCCVHAHMHLQSYEGLKSLSKTNVRILQIIEQSIFAVSLDTHTLGLDKDAVDTPAEVNHHLHNIRSSIDGRNRWFDKAITLIVESNSRAGAMGEHSPCDALVPSIVMEYALVQPIDEDAFDPMPDVVARISDAAQDHHGGWERLDFDLDNRLRAACEEAAVRAKVVIADSDDTVCWFNDFGSNWIKTEGSCSRLSVHTLSHPLPFSPFIAGRLCADGPPTRMVQDARRIYRGIRDRSHAPLRTWSDGNHPLSH
jgi:hypothetical protein